MDTLNSRFTTRTDTKFIVVHCSSTPPSLDIGAYEINNWHTKDRKWLAIGYHFVISRSGKVENGRAMSAVGAGVRGYNEKSVHICLVGGIDDSEYPENNFTSAQFDELYKLILDLKIIYKNASILGHKDFPNVKKACPSFDVKSWFSSHETELNDGDSKYTYISKIENISKNQINDANEKETDMEDEKSWLDKIKEYAPAAVTALINPAAGGALAIRTLSKQLGVGENEEEIKAAVDRMSDGELKLKLKQVDLEFHKSSVEAESQKHRADADVLKKVQDTAIAELKSQDEYVRRTRPMIGRWSFYLGSFYCIGAEFIALLRPSAKLTELSDENNGQIARVLGEVMQKTLETSGADPYIAAAIFAPCMAYIGARSLDKNKAWNK